MTPPSHILCGRSAAQELASHFGSGRELADHLLAHVAGCGQEVDLVGEPPVCPCDAARRSVTAMELVGLEPTTSWVRLRRMITGRREIGAVRANSVTLVSV